MCGTCQKYTGSQPKEPMIPHKQHVIPWDNIGIDMLSLGIHDHLFIMDYFTNFLEMATLEDTTTSARVVRHIKSIFECLGMPRTVITDSGPQFKNGEFLDFAKMHDFHHETSSSR